MEERNFEPVGYTLKRSQHFLRLRMDQRLQEERLTLAQYVALSLFESSPQISNAEIARRAFVTPQTMHRIVSGLERNGLVSRSPDPRNKRVILRSLTAAGQEAVSRGHQVSREVDEEMLRGLSRGERERFAGLLEWTIENLRPRVREDDGAEA